MHSQTRLDTRAVALIYLATLLTRLPPTLWRFIPACEAICFA